MLSVHWSRQCPELTEFNKGHKNTAACKIFREKYGHLLECDVHRAILSCFARFEGIERPSSTVAIFYEICNGLRIKRLVTGKETKWVIRTKKATRNPLLNREVPHSPILERLEHVVRRSQLETNLGKPNLVHVYVSWSSQVILQMLACVLLLL